jgi:hypothetical protein
MIPSAGPASLSTLCDELSIMLGAAFDAYISVRTRVRQGVRPGRSLRELTLWQSELIPEALLGAHGVDGRVAFALAVCCLEEAVRHASTDRLSEPIALVHGFVRGMLATEAGAFWGGILERMWSRQSLQVH